MLSTLHAHGFPAVEQDATGLHVAADGQVHAVLHGVEMGEGGAHADALRVVRGDVAEAVGAGAVHVGNFGVAGSEAGFAEGGLDGQGRLAGAAQHGHGAVAAVEVVANVVVGFQPAQEGQDVEVCPLIVAAGSPVVVVVGQTPQEHLPVDGPGAADHLALGNVNLALHRVDDAPHGPVVGGVLGLGVAALAVLEVVGEMLEIGVVRASFEEEDGEVGVFGEAGCKGASCGAGSDDDDVVFHELPPVGGFDTGRI